MKWEPNQVQLIIQEALAFGESIVACESDRAALLLRRAIYRRLGDKRLSVELNGDLLIVRARRAIARLP